MKRLFALVLLLACCSPSDAQTTDPLAITPPPTIASGATVYNYRAYLMVKTYTGFSQSPYQHYLPKELGCAVNIPHAFIPGTSYDLYYLAAYTYSPGCAPAVQLSDVLSACQASVIPNQARLTMYMGVTNINPCNLLQYDTVWGQWDGTIAFDNSTTPTTVTFSPTSYNTILVHSGVSGPVILPPQGADWPTTLDGTPPLAVAPVDDNGNPVTPASGNGCPPTDPAPFAVPGPVGPA